MLIFDGNWRFETQGPISNEVVWAFADLIKKIVPQGDRYRLLEHFKSHFAGAAGISPSASSSASWAETDLDRYMGMAAGNAPVFIEAFFDACQKLEPSGINLPTVARINRVLLEHNAGYEISPPNLLARNPELKIEPPEYAPSLDDQAKAKIQHSWEEADRFLSEGRGRAAVQEILWLLETVSTAFRGTNTDFGTIQGKYFNKIATDMQRHYRGQPIEQVISWINTLHGYLSSPSGGGIRHGSELMSGRSIDITEARLYCNLIQSYINFLLYEYDRLTRS